VLQASTEQACTDDDSTCYCIPHNPHGDDCFATVQEIMIDHCDIDRFKGAQHVLVFRYTVVNLAGIQASGNQIPVRLLAATELVATARIAAA